MLTEKRKQAIINYRTETRYERKKLMKTANTDKFKELFDTSVEKFVNNESIADKVAAVDTLLLEKKFNALEEIANKTIVESAELEDIALEDFPGVIRPRGTTIVAPGESADVNDYHVNTGDTCWLAIYARQGGGNDECYCDSDDYDFHEDGCLYENNEQIRASSGYIDDFYDSFDSTYITFLFDTGLNKQELDALEKDVYNMQAELREVIEARKMLDLIKNGSLPVWALDSTEQSYALSRKASRAESLEGSLRLYAEFDEDAIEETISNVENFIAYIANIVNSENNAQLQTLLAQPMPVLNANFQKILAEKNRQALPRDFDDNVISVHVESILAELNRAFSLLEEFEKLEELVAESENSAIAKSLLSIAESVSGKKTFSAESVFATEIRKKNAIIDNEKHNLKKLVGLYGEKSRLDDELADLKSQLTYIKSRRTEAAALKEEISKAGLL